MKRDGQEAVNAIETEGGKDKPSLQFVEKDHWPVEKYGPVPTEPPVKEWNRFGWWYDPTPGIFTHTFEYGKLVEKKKTPGLRHW